jgi:hypothetical protein
MLPILSEFLSGSPSVVSYRLCGPSEPNADASSSLGVEAGSLNGLAQGRNSPARRL